MNTFVQKYNRFLILVFSVAPFVAFFTVKFLNIDFNRIMQLMSFVGVFLVFVFRDRNKKIRFPKYLLFYLFFVFYVFYSNLIQLNREFKLMYLFSNPYIGGFNMMFIIENLMIPKRFFIKIIEISKVILILAIFVIIIQQVVDSTFFVNQNISALRFVTDQGIDKNRLVSIYSWIGGFIKVGFAFVPLYLIIVESSIKKKKVFIWIIAGFMFAFLSKARWIMLNTLLVLVLTYMNQKIKAGFFLRYTIILPVIILMSFISLEFIGVNVSGIVKERILESDKANISQTSAGTRILAIKAFNELYWEHPIFGVGNIKYGMGGTGKNDYKLRSVLKGRSSQIHVGYIKLLYIYGVFGASFFIIFLFLLLKRLYIHAKLTNYWASFLGFLGLVIANFTLVTFSVFEMGLILALFVDVYHKKNYEQLNRKYIA